MSTLNISNFIWGADDVLRDVVELMAHLIFLPIADKIRNTPYLVYDGACGTGGMLTVAEETLQRLTGGYPLNMFYNTGIATYIWVLSNRKPAHRKGQRKTSNRLNSRSILDCATTAN